jgi:methionine-rich copper-binding protein CopC
VRRALLCAFVVGVLVALTGTPASAHASLLSSDPEEGSVVAALPDQLVLTFNEPVRLDEVQAFAAGGADWSVDAEAQDNRLVVVPQEDPGTGTVVVAWQVVSEDGHVVGGSLTFSVGSPSGGATAVASGGEGTSRGVEIVRWAAVAVLAGALGAIVVLAALIAIRGTLPARWTHHGLLRILHLLWNTAFVAALALVPLNQLAAEGGSLRDVADWLTWLDGLTRGTTWLLLGGVLLAAGLVAVVRRTARPRHGSLVILRVAVGVLVAAVVAPLVVSVAAGPGSPDGDAAAVELPAPSVGARTADLGGEGTATVSVRQTDGRSYRLRLTLTEPDGEPLRPYAKPMMSVSSDDVDLGDVELRRTGPGAYVADVVIPRDGDWSAEVSVRTSELDNPVAVVPFAVG